MASTLAATLCGSICGSWGPNIRSRVASAARGAGDLGASLAITLTMGERALVHEAKVLRQPLVNRLVHWSVALSVFALFVTGFGQMPLYKRYMVADLPGLGWTADYGTTLLLHYVAAMVLLLAVSFHVSYHGLRRELGCLPRRGDVRQSVLIVRAMIFGGQEPPSEKYLAEQRLAYAAIGGSVLLLTLSGMVKVAKNLPEVSIDPIVVAASTHLHNLGMMLLLLTIVGHLLAFAIPANRKLIPGMLHGKVDLAYTQHRHCLWCEHLLPRNHASHHVGSSLQGKTHEPERSAADAPTTSPQGETIR